jgi:ParB-like chromosome segregation protein Spo0J
LKHNHNKTNDEIAKRIGKSPAFVSQMLSIAESPAEIRESVYSGELSTKDATVILTDAKKMAKQKNNGKPSNELSETIAVELKKKAIEEGKKDGLTVQSRKAKEKTEAPIGNLKKIAELSEIGVSQHMDSDIVEFLDVLHEYLHDCKMTPMEFFERCMASKNAPVIG